MNKDRKNDLFDKFREGDRLALARVISLVENRSEGFEDLLHNIFPSTGQAHRLGIPIEAFGDYALKARKPVKIASRCTVFAESDMIHKQQMGHSAEDIIAGLCEALVRNYLNNLVKSQELREPILFQGGVAANVGMRAAFERVLGKRLIIPPHFEVMGAIGSALLAKEAVASSGRTRFRGFEVGEIDYQFNSFECEGCSNGCEVMEVKMLVAPDQERLVR